MYFIVLCCVLIGVVTGPFLSAEALETPEPELFSLFPLGGQQGTTVQAQIRGRQLAGSYAVWLHSEGLTAQIKKVEEVEEEPAPNEKNDGDRSGEETEQNLPVYRVFVQIDVDRNARIGTHPIRLVSPQGLSSAVVFRVVGEPVIIETEAFHQTAQQAQPVSFPATICGKLTKPGESDYYSLEASEGQEISLQIILAEGFEPRLALYRPTGSWLDPHRPIHLLSEEERSSDLIRGKSQATYRTLPEGRYALEVSSLFGKGSPNCSYQLRIADSEELSGSKQEPDRKQADWRSRTFSRKLESDWIEILHSRTVEAEDSSAAVHTDASKGSSGTGSDVAAEELEVAPVVMRPSSFLEREPNSSVNEALEISVPSIAEGSIERPGDIDIFRFQVEPGQRLAFEIETPETKPPHFHPRMGVVDRENRELFTNVHRRISLFNNNAKRQVYFQSVEPKVSYTFDAGGEYFLQVRDITSRYGDPSYDYRVLVRPQIPHVGEVLLGELDSVNRISNQVNELDRINLIRGQAKKLTLFTSHEEGFMGDVAFSLTGLPKGVEAFPAAEVNDARAPTDLTVKPETLLPKTQETTMVLLAERDTQLTHMPVRVRLHCRPILKGKLGRKLLVREIPLMVVQGIGPER